MKHLILFQSIFLLAFTLVITADICNDQETLKVFISVDMEGIGGIGTGKIHVQIR